MEKIVWLLYADDIDVIGLNNQTPSKLVEEAKCIGLVMNKDNMK